MFSFFWYSLSTRPKICLPSTCHSNFSDKEAYHLSKKKKKRSNIFGISVWEISSSVSTYKQKQNTPQNHPSPNLSYLHSLEIELLEAILTTMWKIVLVSNYQLPENWELILSEMPQFSQKQFRPFSSLRLTVFRFIQMPMLKCNSN